MNVADKTLKSIGCILVSYAADAITEFKLNTKTKICFYGSLEIYHRLKNLLSNVSLGTQLRTFDNDISAALSCEIKCSYKH